MAKSEVYSWRLAPDLKRALEDAARRERRTVAALLSHVVDDWLRRTRSGTDDGEQARLHAAAARCFGTIRGDNPGRSQEVRRLVRERLKARRAR